MLRRIAVALLLSSFSFAATIPAGTRVAVRVNSAISSGTAHSGQKWTGVVARDVVVNGATVAKKGDEAAGTVSYVKPSGRLHAPGSLTLRLTSVAGQSVSSAGYAVAGKSHKRGNIEKIGGGTAAGALIGGIAGGGKGAAIGAAAGAGAGTGVAAATGKTEATIPAEGLVTFTITAGSAAAHHRTARKR
jgi:hypothetical protein